MITVFLGIIAVTEVLAFIKVMVEFVLALHFKKQDKTQREEWDKTLRLLVYQITELNSRVTSLENNKE
jgi:hypothetical protein